MAWGGNPGVREPKEDAQPNTPSPYIRRRVNLVVILSSLTLLAWWNPLRMTVFSHYMLPILGAFILGALVWDVVMTADANPSLQDPVSGRVLSTILVGFTLVVIRYLAGWPTIAAACLLILGILVAANIVKNRLRWPITALAVPVLVVAVLSPFVGAIVYGFSHGPVVGSHTSPYGDVHVDQEQVDGLCTGITNVLRSGGPIFGHETPLGGDCARLDFTAADTLELRCYRYDATPDRLTEYVGRRIVFDPTSLRIIEDTGEIDYC